MKMKTTMVVALAAVMCTGMTYAKGHHGGGFGGPRPMMGGRGGFRPAPVRHHHHHHHGSVWGRGGSNFWPGFVGGVIGGVLADAVVSPAPVVVTTPVVTTPVVTTPVVTTPVVTTPVVTAPVVSTQNVWVEGRYVDQVQPNGTVLRVWQPGHYETRQVAY